MADLQAELQKLVDTLQEKQKAYDTYLDASKKHNDIILALAERQPIDITDFEEAEDLYNEMTLSEKTYRIQNEVFKLSRQDVIAKLAPVQNIKIKFTHVNEKNDKETTDYYVWLKFNAENPNESQLVLQRLDDETHEPLLF
ncbi:hypothetical protein FC093_18175 [Ilyomonas limi]|uniref:Uncharacterized protein n=1 Tax=Ilyomonas limi TaxID=2575867 RepID=A0A4U3KUP1_9BACT|nr:hypothetical protein [Ilyomonas limi]TKK66178.1 hypothetical protein FC093_18175 [Ilyomonas limi]